MMMKEMDFGDDIIQASENNLQSKSELSNIDFDDLEQLEKETFDMDPLGQNLQKNIVQQE